MNDFNLWTELSYRINMPVRYHFVDLRQNDYPICPRCGIMLEREWMKFCDNCGQKLDWKEYK